MKRLPSKLPIVGRRVKRAVRFRRGGLLIKLLTPIMALAMLASQTTALGAVKYWRLSTAGSGSAGGATPSGTWDTTTLNWDTAAAGTGSHVVWVASDDAVFSAAADASGS